jgi:hypothetical protein
MQQKQLALEQMMIFEEHRACWAAASCLFVSEELDRSSELAFQKDHTVCLEYRHSRFLFSFRQSSPSPPLRDRANLPHTAARRAPTRRHSCHIFKKTSEEVTMVSVMFENAHSGIDDRVIFIISITLWPMERRNRSR